MNRHPLLIAMLCASLIAASCQTNRSMKEDAFASIYPGCSMNSEIRFLPSETQLQTPTSIVLEYENTSLDWVAFPADSNIRIFYFDSRHAIWEKINNIMTYSTGPEGYLLISPASDERGAVKLTAVSPALPADPPNEVRISITGHIFRNGQVTDKCVGAFVDLDLARLGYY